jgi:hypothetical protein
MKTNRILAILAAVLFLLSFLSYRDSVTRAERFERGQKFLPNLNPDEITRITLEKDGEETRLNRQGESFTVASENGYPADTGTVNRLIQDVLEIGLEKEVGKKDSLVEELELGPEQALAVTLIDSAGKEMVKFFVGKSFEDGGNYVRKAGEDAMIYLTSEGVRLDTEGDRYTNKEILDVEKSEIQRISGNGYVVERQEGSLELVDLPAGKKESSKVNRLEGLLSGLRFQKHHLANAPEVQGLRFTNEVRFELADDSGYTVSTAERDGKHYLVIQGFHNTTGQVAISLDASEEEVKETSEMLVRQEAIQDFNALHGSWVYEVSSATAETVGFGTGDLVEDA